MGVKQEVLQVKLAVARDEIERVSDSSKEEVALGVVEVVICLQGLQTVD